MSIVADTANLTTTNGTFVTWVPSIQSDDRVALMTLSQLVQKVSRPHTMPRVRCGRQLGWRVYASYTTCMAGSRQVMATRHSIQVLLKDLHQHLSHPQPGIAGHLSPPEDLHNQTSIQWQTVSETDQLVLLMTALMPGKNTQYKCISWTKKYPRHVQQQKPPPLLHMQGYGIECNLLYWHCHIIHTPAHACVCVYIGICIR